MEPGRLLGVHISFSPVPHNTTQVPSPFPPPLAAPERPPAKVKRHDVASGMPRESAPATAEALAAVGLPTSKQQKNQPRYVSFLVNPVPDLGASLPAAA